MLPEGWKSSTVGDHVELLSGHAFKSEEYISSMDGIKLLRGDNVSQGRLRWRDVKRYPQSKTNGLARYHLQVGDFVIAMDRTWIPAGVKVSEIFEDDLPCLLVQRVARLRTKLSLRQDLLRQYFAGHRFEQFVQGVQTETAVPHISPNDIKAFEIALPPLPEQQKIAEILSTWDRAIATQEQLIANASTQKRALMQLLLTPKKRLSGFKGEWNLKKLGDICEPKQWPTIGADQLVATGYPVYGANGFIGYYSEYNHEEETVAVTCRGSTCGEVNVIPRKSYITGNSMSLDEFNPKYYDYKFIYYFLRLRGFEDVISGSAQPQIIGKDIRAIDIAVPGIDEQLEIGSMLSNCDHEIQSLEADCSNLRKEKSALMQQLLTGKRRVKMNGATP